MNIDNLESSKFYSYKFRNFSTMVILPAFILVVIIFISSFFAIRENTVQTVGTVQPDKIVRLKFNSKYKEGKKIEKGREVIHLEDNKAFALPSLVKKRNIKILAYVPSSNIASIAKKQRVRLLMKNSQGTNDLINGKITNIDVYPVQHKEISLYEIDAIINPNSKERKSLRYGMQGRMTIVTGRDTYFDYFKSKLFDEK